MRGFWGTVDNTNRPGSISSNRTLRSASILLASALALSACSSIDNMMFGDGEANPTNLAGSSTSGRQSVATGDINSDVAPNATPAYSAPGSLPPLTSYSTTAVTSSAAGNTVSVTPITIEPGSDTGTQVNQTIQQLRGQISGLQQRVSSHAQRLSDVRSSNSASATTFQDSKAQIQTRLQLGTTRGNPELVARWNTAQSALDQLTANINTLSALASDVSTDSSAAHFALDQIVATFNVSGAVDEDHRQLAVLEDETNQTIILIDRILKSVTDDLQRQTTYVSNERANLTSLANGIKNGELYSAAPVAPSRSQSALRSSGKTTVAVIGLRSGNFQTALYNSLNQTLETRPQANFEVVAVSTAGDASQSNAKKRAQEVFRAMTDMGVPATRVSLASITDPALSSGEVRVYQR